MLVKVLAKVPLALALSFSQVRARSAVLLMLVFVLLLQAKTIQYTQTFPLVKTG